MIAKTYCRQFVKDCYKERAQQEKEKRLSQEKLDFQRTKSDPLRSKEFSLVYKKVKNNTNWLKAQLEKEKISCLLCN